MFSGFLELVLISTWFWGGSAGPGCSDHFEMTLKAQAADRVAQSHSTATLGTARPVLTVKGASILKVHWSVASMTNTGNIPDVTIHFFLARQEKIGQRELPKIGADVTAEGALIMDFEPQAKSSAELSLQVPEPGNYLLRVETIGTLKRLGHEHFVALDVKVE